MTGFDVGDLVVVPQLTLLTDPSVAFTHAAGVQALAEVAITLGKPVPTTQLHFRYNGRECTASAFPLSFFDCQLVALQCGGISPNPDFRYCILLSRRMRTGEKWYMTNRMLQIMKVANPPSFIGPDTSRINAALVLAFAATALAKPQEYFMSDAV